VNSVDNDTRGFDLHYDCKRNVRSFGYFSVITNVCLQNRRKVVIKRDQFIYRSRIVPIFITWILKIIIIYGQYRSIAASVMVTLAIKMDFLANYYFITKLQL